MISYIKYVFKWTSIYISLLKTNSYRAALKSMGFWSRAHQDLYDSQKLMGPFTYYKVKKLREAWVIAAKEVVRKRAQSNHEQYEKQFGRIYKEDKKPLFEFCFKINNLTKDKQ